MWTWIKVKTKAGWEWIKRQIFPVVVAATVATAGGVVAIDEQIDPYTDRGDRFQIELIQNISESGLAEVEFKKDKPEIRFKKWNGEVDLGVFYSKVKGQGKRALLTNRIEWKDGNEEVHAYPIDDENFEVEIVLKRKPDTNLFEFQIDGHENLDFFYQPALDAHLETDEEKIASGCTPTDCNNGHRPENIVGSYAVYHKTKANHIVGQTNYETGKAFHIYRPKAIDASGNEAWAILNYFNGILNVTVPQVFLDNASYPVKVDPTFGYTTVGGTNDDQNLAWENGDLSATIGQTWALAETEVTAIDSMDVALGISDTNENSVDVSAVLYREDSVASGSHGLVALVERVDLDLPANNAHEFFTFTFNSENLGADDYVLATIADGNDIAPAFQAVRLAYDTGGSTRNRYITNTSGSSSYTTQKDADPYVDTATSDDRQYSIFVTYTVIQVVETATSTATADTTTTMNGEITQIGANGEVEVGFEYGIDAFGGETGFSATTTTLTATTSIGTYSEDITGLTTFEEYGFRAWVAGTSTATSTGKTFQFFTADISTSTPVVAADNHEWDLGDFSNGSSTDTTGTTILSLTEILGGWATSTDSFEGVSDASTDFSSTVLWKQAPPVTADGGDWQGETGATGSSGTGADEGSDGDVFIFTEASGGQQCATGTQCTIEAEIATSTKGQIIFDYWYEGAGLSTFTLDAWDGSTWVNLGFSKDGTTESAAWASSTPAITWEAIAGYGRLRFDAPNPTSFSSDISLDHIQVATTSVTYIDGAWTSPAWTITGVDFVEDSHIEFSSTTPSDTDVRVLVAVNSDGGTQPDEGDFTELQSGDNMSAAGVTGDLTGNFVWVRIEMDASTDAADTPTVTQLIMGINDGEAVSAEVETADNDYQNIIDW